MNQDHEHKRPARDQDDSQDEDDSIFDALEKEDDSAYRAQRIDQLNAEFASAKNNQTSGQTTTHLEDTSYPTLKSDQALLDFTTNTHRCVIHFGHPDFARCSVMDEHIKMLAARHYDVRFARVDVRETPFVVEKLNIRVLPCVIGFKDGVGVERVVGFEGLGSGGKDGADTFNTAILEKRLLLKGILGQAKLKAGDDDSGASDEEGDDEDDARRRNGGRRTIRSGNVRRRNDDNDDDDWD